MRMRSAAPVIAGLLITTAACDGHPAALDDPVGTPEFAIATGPTGGALVTSPGMGTFDGTCNFGAFLTDHVVAIRAPNGQNLKLMCQFDGLPPIPERDVREGFQCDVIIGGINFTNESRWMRTKSGHGTLTCQFDREPAFDARIEFGSNEDHAAEARFSLPLADFPDRQISGDFVFIGRACSFDLPLLDDPAGKIAVIERGACRFDEKVGIAEAHGAIAAVVFNDAFHGDALLTMGGNPRGIPAVMVEHSAGIALLSGAASSATLTSCRNPSGSLQGCR